MPDQIITAPDGSQHAFPDTASDADINAKMESYWGSRNQQPQQPKPTPLQAPGMMPSGTTTVGPAPGNFSARIGSNIETGMTPLSGEAQRALKMLSLAGTMGPEGRTMEMAANQILAKDPTFQARKAQADAMGKTAGQRQQMREAGENILDPYSELLRTVETMPDKQLLGAIGQRNQATVAEKSPTYIPGTRLFGYQGVPLPFFEGPTTVDPKTGVPIAGDLRTVQRDAIVNPNDPTAQANADTDNLLRHLRNGITTAIMAQVKAGTMTDAKMEKYDAALNDFANASNKQEALKVLRHAGLLIQNDFSLTPEEFGQTVERHKTRHAAEAAQQEQQNRFMAASKSVPDKALSRLFQNHNDPNYVAQFNKTFNQPGLAEALIKAHLQAAAKEIGG